jgi:hypothetical protein
MAYLRRGDVASALPILSTLALGAANSAVQRRRQLLHSRIHRESSAVMACLGSQVLSAERRSAICDAVLDKDLPAAVFFGNGKGAEATRRLQALRLAVHPDKCTADNAAAAIARLHERKVEHDATVDEAEADSADSEPVKKAASPSPNSTPHTVPVSSGSFQRSGATSPLASTLPSRSGRASSKLARAHLSRSVPTRVINLNQQTSRGSFVLSRNDGKGRESPADSLQKLMSGIRATNSVRLDCDLSFESCGATMTTPAASPEDESLNRILTNSVQSEFDRLRAALVGQLRDQATDDATVHDALEATLVDALQNSMPEFRPPNQSRDEKRTVVAASAGLLPVLKTKRRAKPL